MQNPNQKRAVTGFAALASCATLLAGTTQAATIFAIDDNPGQHLLAFDSATPSILSSSFAISGLQANEKLIGIDFRISASGINQNALYGVGSFGRIYTVNPSNGAATFIGSLNDGVNPIVLNGTEFGFDFNPQADRLRIVSDLDQNLRVNVDTGLTVIDTPLNPGNPNVTDVAYDRNDQNAGTPTTLFGIDTVANQLVRIGGVDGTPSPNGGLVTPIGPLSLVNPIAIGGFDIAPGTGVAFAALRPAGTTDSSILYTINLATGGASPVGTIGNAEDGLVIKGIAVQDVPEPATVMLAGVFFTAAMLRRRK